MLSTHASAAAIHIDFSGHFSACLWCAGTGLDSLLGSDFSGAIVFPDSAASAISTTIRDPSPTSLFAHARRADYHLRDSDARFTLHTALPAFDLDGSIVPVVVVQDCTDSICAFKDDFVWILVNTPSHFVIFYLPGFGGPGGAQLDDVNIPALETLQALARGANFDIEPLDNSAGVGPAEKWPTSMNVSIASTPVPLPGSLLPLACAALLLRNHFLRKQHR